MHQNGKSIFIYVIYIYIHSNCYLSCLICLYDTLTCCLNCRTKSLKFNNWAPKFKILHNCNLFTTERREKKSGSNLAQRTNRIIDYLVQFKGTKNFTKRSFVWNNFMCKTKFAISPRKKAEGAV